MLAFADYSFRPLTHQGFAVERGPFDLLLLFLLFSFQWVLLFFC